MWLIVYFIMFPFSRAYKILLLETMNLTCATANIRISTQASQTTAHIEISFSNAIGTHSTTFRLTIW